MIFSDSTSSQAAHRQRRLAADEKIRVDKAVNDAAVREGVVRQAGEAPTRGEVDRFQSLMQSRAQTPLPQPKAPMREADQRAHPGVSAHTPAPQGDVLAQTIGERFRALLQSSADATHGVRDGGDDVPAGASRDADAKGLSARTPDASGEVKEARDPAPEAADAPNRSAHARVPVDKPVAGKAVADADDGSKPGVAKGQAVDEGESPQQLAQRVARGEVHAAPVRSTRKGDTEAGGNEKDAMSSSAVGTPTQTPMSNDSIIASGTMSGGEGPRQAQVAAGVIAPGLSELIEKHVKQLLVGDARGSRSRSREVLLRLQSDILPGTDLWLTRSGEGWQLRADVRSRDAYDTLLANQDELIQRFADRALGALSIDPVFHGEGSAVAGLGSTAIKRQR